MRYIYQHKDWPKFRWDSTEIASDLEAASFAIGKFSGRLAAIGFEMQSDAVCETLSAEIQTGKDAYYDAIDRAQRGTLDVTRWIRWFLCCHRRAVWTAWFRCKAEMLTMSKGLGERRGRL